MNLRGRHSIRLLPLCIAQGTALHLQIRAQQHSASYMQQATADTLQLAAERQQAPAANSCMHQTGLQAAPCPDSTNQPSAVCSSGKALRNRRAARQSTHRLAPFFCCPSSSEEDDDDSSSSSSVVALSSSSLSEDPPAAQKREDAFATRHTSSVSQSSVQPAEGKASLLPLQSHADTAYINSTSLTMSSPSCSFQEQAQYQAFQKQEKGRRCEKSSRALLRVINPFLLPPMAVWGALLHRSHGAPGASRSGY